MICCDLLVVDQVIAQTKDTTSVKTKPQLFFKLNSRRSFVSGEKISIRGVRLGVEFNNKHRFGIGLFDSGLLGLNGGANIKFFDIKLSPRPLNVEVELGYMALFYEQQIYRDKKWGIYFDTQLGLGKAFKTFRDVNDIILKTKKLNKPLFETTFGLKYKILPWIGASAGLGYRYILDGSDAVVRKAFNSPIYVLKVRVSISYFVKRVVLG